MQEDASIRFDPVRPRRLELWELVLASIAFVALIIVIARQMRRRATRNPGSLDLNRK